MELWLEDQGISYEHVSLLTFILWAVWVARKEALFNAHLWTPLQVFYKIQNAYTAYENPKN